MKPKKSFGQNFLTSIPARNAIVAAGHIEPDDTVLEIGPGRGFLTEGLLEAGANVIALEADRDLIPVLEEKFKILPSPPAPLQALERGVTQNTTQMYSRGPSPDPGEVRERVGPALNLINIDALKYDTLLIKGKYKLIANIPYNITGAIIEKYLSTDHKPTSMVILVQREVAERIVSRDGHESILSIAVAVYGQAKIIYKVSAGSFYPKPKVDSAVLAIYNINNDFFDNFKNNKKVKENRELDAEQTFFKILRGGFQYKRKYLINNLTEILIKENFISNKEQAKDLLIKIFKELNIDERERAENVKIDKWKQLFSLIYAQV